MEKKPGPDFVPLHIGEDYKQYIDGISRFDGVRNFLTSRNIKLPEEETVFGLGMRKNELFPKILDREGAHIFPDTLEMVRKWKGEGKHLATISASRNCRQIMDAAGVAGLFNQKVDGETLQQENL